VSRYRKGTQLQSKLAAPGTRIETAINAFLDAQERMGRSPRYLEELRSYLVGGGKRTGWSPLLPWTAGRVDALTSLDRSEVEAYLSQASKASRLVYAKVCMILGLFLAWCVSEAEISALPCIIPRPKRQRAEIRVFVRAEMLRLRDLVRKENVRDWAIFLLLLDTGIRASELCGLQVSDIRWDREEVLIRPEISKNRRPRVIPLSGSLSALRKYRILRGDSHEDSTFFFLSFYSTPVVSGGKSNMARRPTKVLSLSRSALTRVGLYQLVAKWGRLAGITEARCSPHTFRHFFATEYLRNGGNIVVLQRILGHSRLDVTERYLRVVAANLTESQKHFSPANAFASVNPRHERLR
jgi:integrase